MEKLLFYIRMFLGTTMILFSGLMTLPIYIAIKTSNDKEIFGTILLCVVSLVTGHWWLKRAHDKNKNNAIH